MKICKKCGTENHPDEIFCTNCGENLMRKEYLENSDKPETENEAVENTAVEVENEVIDEPSTEPAESSEATDEEAEKKPKSKKKIIVIIAIIFGVLILAGAGVCAYFMFFKIPDKPTDGQIFEALNSDKSITQVDVGSKKYDFSVIKVEKSKEALDNNNYKFSAEITRENDTYGISPVSYNVTFKRKNAEFVYDKAEAQTDEHELYAVKGVEEDIATAKVRTYYKEAEFKQRDTDLEKGVDRLYYTVKNKEYDGILAIRYDFSKTNGWVFKKFSDKKLELVKGVTHKVNGLLTNSSVKNVLLLGVDSDSGEGRSDCMMLISVDSNTGTIKQTSFMRDNWFNIPGHGPNKLNAAFALGGPELTVKTIQSTFGIRIDNYACVSFTTFKEVINALDGIDVKITSDEAGYINWQINKNGQAGTIGLVKTSGGVTHLNGQQALWLCRDRGGNGFGGDDFTRAGRQRRVIRSIVKAYKDYTPVKVLKTIGTIRKSVKTNLTKKDLKWYAKRSGRFFDYKFKERGVPEPGEWQSGTSAGGAWIIQLNDFKKLKSDIQHFIYEDLK